MITPVILMVIKKKKKPGHRDEVHSERITASLGRAIEQASTQEFYFFKKGKRPFSQTEEKSMSRPSGASLLF